MKRIVVLLSVLLALPTMGKAQDATGSSTISVAETRQLVVVHEAWPQSDDIFHPAAMAQLVDQHNQIVGFVWAMRDRYPEAGASLSSSGIFLGMHAEAPDIWLLATAFTAQDGRQVSIQKDTGFEARALQALRAQSDTFWVAAPLAWEVQQEGYNRLIKVVEGMINLHPAEMQALLTAYRIRIELPDARKVGYGVP